MNVGRALLILVGLLFLGIVFYPMLAFGDAQYIGAGGNANASNGEALDSIITEGEAS